MKNTVAVIGGGMMGMTVALRMSEKGYDVSLYEASESLGGLASAWQIDDIVWDKFYHVVLLSDLYTRKIIKEIGLEEETNWVETKTGFYSGGKLFSMSNLIEFFKFPPINLIDKFRLGLTIFAASKMKNWKRLENIKVENWLTKWSGKNTFNKIWLPLLRAKLGENYKETSAAFIWATIQRMYAARNTGLKKEMFGYVSGGYANILDKLHKHIESKGIKVFTSHITKSITKKENEFEIVFENGHIENVKNVISTIPSSINAELIKDLQTIEIEKLKSVQYLGVVCTSILIKNQLSPYYVTNITDDAPFTGIIEMGALVDRKNFNGHSLIYLPKYVKASDEFYHKSNAEIENIFISKLKEMYPEIKDEDIICVQTARAANVFALPTIAYSISLTNMQTSVEGIFIINSSYITNSTLNVNDTVKLAEDAVDKYF
ncbi:MAG: NAD(P)/FAD-dependent oxidoreductase [Bacteroidetes bacterium]|nr:NAD(P)/FAD-dependent oxidoreductase [Bacteroidota bacterium]MBT7040531.1 NAD(P)/FAD-dependent oxidoreductase [Bacteroidota bacterium]